MTPLNVITQNTYGRKILILIYFSLSGVLLLTQIINPFRLIPFNFKDQFSLAFGGLRSAITFALAFTLPNNIEHRALFITATITLILVTVTLQVSVYVILVVVVKKIVG